MSVDVADYDIASLTSQLATFSEKWASWLLVATGAHQPRLMHHDCDYSWTRGPRENCIGVIVSCKISIPYAVYNDSYSLLLPVRNVSRIFAPSETF